METQLWAGVSSGIKWRKLARRLLRAALPVIIIPGAVIALVVLSFGVSLGSLTAVLFLGQIYFIWAQLEVSLMHTEVAKLEYEPHFWIDVESHIVASFSGGKAINPSSYTLKLRNEGAMARNVIVYDSGPNAARFDPKFFSSIPKGGSETLWAFAENLKEMEFAIDVSYSNLAGDFKSLRFSKLLNEQTFIFNSEQIRAGVLLRSVDDLISIPRMIIALRKIKRFEHQDRRTSGQQLPTAC